VALVGMAAGAVAAVAGFGVGSLLTPFLVPSFGGKTAVALVAFPHAIATAIRLWRLRAAIDWRILKAFGTASAAGGLTGAWLFTQAAGSMLAVVLGVLLMAVGGIQLAGLAVRLRIAPAWSALAGALSGLFGGLVGNQGGIRSAALLGFDLPARVFVATGGAIALIVDAVRLPVYLVSQGHAILDAWRVVLVATIGVVAGTFAGTSILFRLSERTFGRVIGTMLLALGAWLLWQEQ
jgi:uncharacterized membrane protein YfcA